MNFLTLKASTKGFRTTIRSQDQNQERRVSEVNKRTKQQSITKMEKLIKQDNKIQQTKTCRTKLRKKRKHTVQKRDQLKTQQHPTPKGYQNPAPKHIEKTKNTAKQKKTRKKHGPNNDGNQKKVLISHRRSARSDEVARRSSWQSHQVGADFREVQAPTA